MPDVQIPKRHDPPSRPVDGAINDIARWANLDKANRDYCEANPNDNDTGVQEMRRLGWVIEKSRKDGPRLLGGDAATDGDVLARNGMYLMSRTREASQAYHAEKLAEADRRSSSIGKYGGADPVRDADGHALARVTEDARERVVRG